MNRYPLWKYLTVLIAVVIGLLYTLPNFYGESPAVQISSAKATIKVEQRAAAARWSRSWRQANLPTTGAYYEQNGPLGTHARALLVHRPATAGARPDRQNR